MKPKVFHLIFALLPLFAARDAQAQGHNQNPEFRKMFLTFGVGANMIGEETFPYFKFDFGFHLSPKSLLTLELGGGSFTDKQLGTFTYGNANQTYHDGKISYDYVLFSPSLSWSYIFGDASRKVRWRVGPSVGLLQLSGSDSFTPTSKNGVTINGIPDPQSESKSAGVFGAHVGLTWNFARRWFADFEYRLSANTGNLSFEEREIIFAERQRTRIDAKKFGVLCNKIVIAVGWRFGKL